MGKCCNLKKKSFEEKEFGKSKKQKQRIKVFGKVNFCIFFYRSRNTCFLYDGLKDGIFRFCFFSF